MWWKLYMFYLYGTDYSVLLIVHTVIIIDKHICWSKRTTGDREIQKTYWIQHVNIHEKHIFCFLEEHEVSPPLKFNQFPVLERADLQYK